MTANRSSGTFPKCLQRPDLGGTVRVRSSQTEAAYRIRYAGWMKTLSGSLGISANVVDVIDDLRERALSLKPNSYYLYRATVLQQLRDRFAAGDLTEQQVERLVRRMTPYEGAALIGSKAPRRRTSAGTRQHLRPASVGTLVTMAGARCHPTFDDLASLLEYGVKVGTRPCELIGARLKGRILSIRSAKYSAANERGIGEFRSIGLLDEFDDFDLDGLGRLLTRLAQKLESAGGDRTRLVRRYGDALRRLRRGEAWASRITLKTTRSQCRANLARAGYSPREIAAIFGHASAETAASHYGSVNKGWRPMPGRHPLAISDRALREVRPGARTKAKLARNQPLTLTEVRASFRSYGPK
ncbi:hypothetical protein V1290_005379 [Bradyrhizobium sp. AZCC 1578]